MAYRSQAMGRAPCGSTPLLISRQKSIDSVVGFCRAKLSVLRHRSPSDIAQRIRDRSQVPPGAATSGCVYSAMAISPLASHSLPER